MLFNNNTFINIFVLFQVRFLKMDRDVCGSREYGYSEVQYAWVILFMYNIEEPQPFSMFPLSLFLGSDFPWDAVKGSLSSEFRVKSRAFSNLPGQLYTIFAKVEVGKFVL